MTRPCKPTSVLELEKGTLYSDQRDRQAFEPKAERTMAPRCPQRFTAEERKAWKGLASVLKNYGLFTSANAIHLELLAVSWSQYLEACRQMTVKAKGNLFISDGKGGFRENPMLRTQQRLRAEISQFCTNLGLSSIALAKMGSLMLQAKKQRNEMEDLLD